MKTVYISHHLLLENHYLPHCVVKVHNPRAPGENDLRSRTAIQGSALGYCAVDISNHMLLKAFHLSHCVVKVHNPRAPGEVAQCHDPFHKRSAPRHNVPRPADDHPAARS